MADNSTRVVEGTAGHAAYQRATRHVTLSDGVNATLTDSAHLNGAGVIKGASAVIDTSVSPYRYTVQGGGSGDIRFTPRQNSPNKAGGAKSLNAGQVHIYGFDSGGFQVGETAQFRGPNTTAEFDNPTDKTHGQFRAETITASFTADRSTLSRAEATGNVRYDIQRPAPDGSLQTLNGTSSRAAYDTGNSTIVLEGAVSANITDPATLLKPAHVSADRVVATLDEKGIATRYEITGLPAHTSLRFTPKPRAEAAQTAADTTRPKVFPLGDVEVARFNSGVFEPGKTLTFRGAETIFGTLDRNSRTRTRFQAGNVVATFADNQNIGRIEASGDVHFHVEQPALTTATQGGGTDSVTGTATSATFVNSAQTREVTVHGPLQAAVRSPSSLEGPGTISGEQGDTLRLNLAVTPYEFDIDSPQQTATIVFEPRTQEQAAPAPPGKRQPVSKPPSGANRSDKK